jgi:hypothetical protein
LSYRESVDSAQQQAEKLRRRLGIETFQCGIMTSWGEGSFSFN